MVTQASKNKKDKQDHGINNPLPQRLYPLSDAAMYLGRSVYSVRELIWSGQLPVIKSGKKQWLDIRDMDTWIEKNKTWITA